MTCPSKGSLSSQGRVVERVHQSTMVLPEEVRGKVH